jgi:hypothetical protein
MRSQKSIQFQPCNQRENNSEIIVEQQTLKETFSNNQHSEIMLFQPTPSSLSPIGSFQSQDSNMDKNQQASSKLLHL